MEISKELDFRLRHLITKVLVDRRIVIAPERVKFAVIEEAGALAFNALLTVVTKDTRMATYPANWQEAIKECWAPKWWKKHYPVRYMEVVAQSCLPEINPPDFGTEYIVLKKVVIPQ